MALPNPLYAGNGLTTTVTFTVANGTITDPDTVTLKYKAGSAATVTWTYLGTGSIMKTGTGVYTAELDTTALAGSWTIEWIGTGACAAVSVSNTQVSTPPI